MRKLINLIWISSALLISSGVFAAAPAHSTNDPDAAMICIDALAIPEQLDTPEDFTLLFSNALLPSTFNAIQEQLLIKSLDMLAATPQEEEGDGQTKSGQHLMRYLNILARHIPHLELDAERYPPRLRKLFERARAQTKMEHLYIHESPQLDGALINGVLHQGHRLMVPKDVRLVIQKPSILRPSQYQQPQVRQSNDTTYPTAEVNTAESVLEAQCVYAYTSGEISNKTLKHSSAHRERCRQSAAHSITYQSVTDHTSRHIACANLPSITQESAGMSKRHWWWIGAGAAAVGIVSWLYFSRPAESDGTRLDITFQGLGDVE